MVLKFLLLSTLQKIKESYNFSNWKTTYRATNSCVMDVGQSMTLGFDERDLIFLLLLHVCYYDFDSCLCFSCPISLSLALLRMKSYSYFVNHLQHIGICLCLWNCSYSLFDELQSITITIVAMNPLMSMVYPLASDQLFTNQHQKN